MSEKVLFDAGNAATIHDRLTGHMQTGTLVRGIVGTERDWEYAEGEIVGWREVDGVRKARVLFTRANGMKVECLRPAESLTVAVKRDPTRIPAHSEAQFSPTMSHEEYARAIANDDLMREHCE